MKKAIIIALIIIGAVATGAQAFRTGPLIAQSGAEPQGTGAPDVQPAVPPEAPADAGEAVPREQKQSHKDFGEMALKECAGCHVGSGVAPNHDAGWIQEHRLPAGSALKNCADCHGQQFCLDCHTGGGIDPGLTIDTAGINYKPRSHRTDFRELHPLKAQDDPRSCYRCHDERYCSSCHAKFRGEDLMVQSHRRSWSDLSAVPLGPVHSTFTTAQCQTCHPGGVLPTHVWSSDHAREARRNLQACQTCHSDGQICMTCHSARAGLRINPHPRGWNSIKDRYRSRSGGRSCIKCHDTY